MKQSTITNILLNTQSSKSQLDNNSTMKSMIMSLYSSINKDKEVN